MLELSSHVSCLERTAIMLATHYSTVLLTRHSPHFGPRSVLVGPWYGPWLGPQQGPEYVLRPTLSVAFSLISSGDAFCRAPHQYFEQRPLSN